MGIYYPFLGGGRTCNQITTPLVYDESLSVEQQIACLFGKIANIDRKSTRLNSSHITRSRMPSSA